LNPLHFVDLPKPVPFKKDKNKPSLYFIGRTEKCKGPDIFVDLIWWLSPNKYHESGIIGPHSYDEFGNSSQMFLENMIKNRLVNTKIFASRKRQEIEQLFATKTVIFITSRYDTLNLVALESLFSGCPTVIGNGAGVCQFLQEDFPQIPWVKLDVNNIYKSLNEISNLLDNYPEYRKQLEDTILSLNIHTDDPQLADIYNANSEPDLITKLELKEWYSQLMSFYKSQSKPKKLLVKFAKTIINDVAKPSYGNLRDKLTKFVEDTRTSQLVKSPFLTRQYNQIFKQGEYTNSDLEDKLKKVWNLSQTLEPELKGIKAKIQSGYRLDRARIWREIARLERMRGNDLIAATYQIRSMRALGSDRFGELPLVIKTLQEKGFSPEAKVIEGIYGDINQQEEKCTLLLEQAYQNNLNYREQDYEFTDDRREESQYKVSVIVSLYNAAAKLARFLEVLTQQTLFKQNQVEVILIDSGSPDQEYEVFQKVLPKLNHNLGVLPMVYARSKKRETIQNAWNRGILLSRSPYITFLGVDETIVPESLQVLAAELDQNPEIDWVVGHSLVTNVDSQGNRVNDIMLYDRRNYNQNLVYLDTCYLTYVGGLYRRQIHEQFGYYDPSFRGAGDTEFKNRVLPYIKTKIVNRVLGLFWNYPDERTTQSPLAEIEDIRAWYLHRTLAGIKYAFNQKSPEEVEKSLYLALAYRKSYCKHISSDIDYAANLSQFLAQISPKSEILRFKPSIDNLLSLYRNLDWIEEISTFKPLQIMGTTRKKAKQIEAEHRKIADNLGKLDFNPNYDIFHDNRHEQHANLWVTQLHTKN
jgi:glycosyltransferase involved in cell wall biosynthesis